MSLSNLTDRRAVLKAIDEFDDRGRREFLEKYGFGEARSYYLLYKGRQYDSKAIAGVAHGIENPNLGPLKASEFSGGASTVKKKLENLGFAVFKREADEKIRNYWAFAANPNRYRIRDAIRTLDEDLWTVGKSSIKFGDRAIIWQTLDEEGRRGILALGDIRSAPEYLSDENNTFWIDERYGASREPRVWVRYVRSNSFPIWLGEDSTDPLLTSLSVYKARGGSVFHVEDSQWWALMEHIGGWPGELEDELLVEEIAKEVDSGVPSKGQERVIPHIARRVVEEHAMKLAKNYFESEGMEVVDVSSRASFDLLCRTESKEFHVEVKGTTTEGWDILLTSNEVGQTEEFECMLFVVSRIQLDGKYSEHPHASGGEINIFRPWRARQHSLRPLTYKCTLDYSKAQRISV